MRFFLSTGILAAGATVVYFMTDDPLALVVGGIGVLVVGGSEIWHSR